MSTPTFKAQAQRLADHLSRVHGVKLKHSAVLETLAALHGAADWNTLRAQPAPDLATPTRAPHHSGVPEEGGWQAQMLSRILESVDSGGPLLLGEPEDESMHRKQLARMVQAFPSVFDFWHQNALPGKLAPRCFCCQRDIYEAPVAVKHPHLPKVHVCVECVPNPPPTIEFGVWLIDEGDYVAARSLAEALTWYDAKHGPTRAEEGRLAELRALSEPIHTTQDKSGPTKPLRQLVTELLRAGGTLPAVVAHDFGVL